ncbi:isochorismate synthase [Chloroflexus aggregans]|uniref:isochorismate synthase n=1 Tax=Chloroflexus aggregans (strain MD-66 / DSM 9485) TaxID=326427 RepID=B8GCW7_CHLAD|nr:isochorismate synthase [Chloroflexus aggregans]ACL23167.1 isochorismate synthase [Chloroflexus aggregans DSM 9485]
MANPLLGVRVTTATLREVPRMEAAAEIARRRARELGRPVLVSVTTQVGLRDPLALFARGAGVTHNRFFWSVPAANFEITGLGAAWSFTPPLSTDRFAASAEAWRQLMAEAVIDADRDLPVQGPLAVAGFRFDPDHPPSELWRDYPHALLLVPRLLIVRHGDVTTLTVNGMVDAQSSTLALGAAAARRLQALIGLPWRPNRPPLDVQVDVSLDPDVWKAIVADAVTDLRAGMLEKVVLARAMRLRGPEPFDTAATLDTLRRDYPHTFIFAVARGGRTFLGASPERLVSLRNGDVAASALAGSAPRGKTPEEDAALASALLQSEKDRAEHAFVVQMIRAALTDYCDAVQAPELPTIMQVRNVQHLFTPITARIRPGYDIFDLVQRLHPTPAVGGKPGPAALAWIRAREQLDRGWYAAPVGWVDARGDGEFAVALRSALIGRREATLFAGCGIVAASDPERELAETRIKLRAMLGALGVGDEMIG